TESNVSPVIFAKNQTHVDLDAAHPQDSGLIHVVMHRGLSASVAWR
ncbi:MAG: hypothetical protein QOG57_5450, partial [Pseudonocardiales bacterium]|nr:hypothetical protein [Pseudonocardiales bacterium]